MAEAYFYHLTRRSVVETLAQLLPRCLSQGWRVAVRCGDEGRIGWLDDKLWLGPPESFLPHGVAGGPHDAHQPILLTPGAATNAPHCLMSVDGAAVSHEEIASLERACILFDGTDGEALSRARGQWTALTGAGIGARYWSEESGKWEQKATKNID
ncbi:DNA polymerase III subunit chi [Jannaschia sp. 2305UL9-9]|uniref:DNA polymerase III subunit chi n=1 Tax=Jannaschia sp. 2305UL9-9 TaxID=3121638 RepID=UPI0035273778